jgi:hypothetical protein
MTTAHSAGTARRGMRGVLRRSACASKWTLVRGVGCVMVFPASVRRPRDFVPRQLSDCMCMCSCWLRVLRVWWSGQAALTRS